MVFETYTLGNGIRIIHHRVVSAVAHCGLLVNTGSRDETAAEHGMAHFVEHVLFKGTGHRKLYHILCRLDDVGGEINAYTTKEETCLHASFLKKDYERAVELIADIMFNPSLPEKELKTEKDVILDEINSYLDNPGELIFDDFEELVFRDTPIGRNILGSPESLRNFTREDVIRFIATNYPTTEMIFASVGDIPFSRIVRMASKHLGNRPRKIRLNERLPVNPYQPFSQRLEKKTYQTHCIIGNVAYEMGDERRITLHLLNNILGGQGLNSRLNLSLREKNGYAYNIESSYHPYMDTGVLTVYFGTDRENIEKSLRLSLKEFKKLREISMGSLQLSRAKQQITGQLVRASENHESLMLSMAKSLLVYGKADTVGEMVNRIQAVSSSELLEIANDILDENRLSYLIYY